MIDLHCHSLASDGLHTPSELIDRAVKSGVRLLALTDHDTILGLTELHEYAKNKALKIVNGIELSVTWNRKDIHIVGLNFKMPHPTLDQIIELQSENRTKRAHAIAQRLEQCGLQDVFAKASAFAGHNRLGRPHFAQVLLAEGYVNSLQMAFKRYLGRGKPAYVPTQWLDLSLALDAIIKAGGVAVLAHPLKYSLTHTRLNALLKDFKAYGGTGMEVVSGSMSKVQIQEMNQLASRFGFLASSGSDFHGDRISIVSIGKQPLLPGDCIPIWKSWNLTEKDFYE